MIEFLKQYQIAEFDLDRGDLKIRLKFNEQPTAQAGLGDLARLLSSAPAPVHAAAPAVAHATAPEDRGIDRPLLVTEDEVVVAPVVDVATMARRALADPAVDDRRGRDVLYR